MKMYYFTDPMCSWCYGFSPIVKKLKEEYPQIELEIISGGFSPFSTQQVDKDYKKFLEFHWTNVNKVSGQYFNHEMKFVSDSFQYDSEPSSRALVVMQQLIPGKHFEFLSLMQKSFYVEGKDITNENILAELSAQMGVEKSIFLECFHSQEMKHKTIQGFELSKQLGVKGFPTLLTLENDTVKMVTYGFTPFDKLKTIIDYQFQNLISTEKNTASCSDNSCGF